MRIDPIVDQRTARIAERHYGFVTRTQATEAGHTESSLRTRVRNGLLERRGRLYRVPGAPRSWQGDVYAAVSNGSTTTVASAMTAAALFGIWVPPLVPHITVPRAGNRRVPGAVVHRSDLDPKDWTLVGVIRTTTPARTLVDCAGLLQSDQVCELVDAAFVAGLATAASVEQAIARASAAPGRKGIPLLRQALAIWSPGIERDSVAEARLFRLLISWGFPPPEALYVIRTPDGDPVCEVDAAWPQRKVALEYDSSQHHHERRWATDERRAGAAKALGWEVVPVEKTDLRPGGHRRLRDQLTALLNDAR
jgi:hypothetical protein